MDGDGGRWRRGLRRVNPAVALGVVVLLAGLGLTLWQAGSPVGGLRAAVRLTQRVILRVDGALSAPQFRYNAAMAELVVESFSPEQQRALAAVGRPLGSLLADLLSLGGIATLVAGGATYVLAARLFDRHYPDARG
jgi:hypothetical protein